MSTNFLIQVFEKPPYIHDFSFTLVDACEYNNWYFNETKYNYQYVTSDEVVHTNLGYIPIGSIEFVLAYLKKYYNRTPKPKQIPDEFMLYKYLKRKCSIKFTDKIQTPCFYKQIDIFKGEAELNTERNIVEVPKGKYFVSEIVDFKSEWRAFVYKNKLVGLENYSGDFTMFPDMYFIGKVMVNYSNPPIAYTIDVGIVNKSTCLIEIHDFFSVGLYGFEDKQILPAMYVNWFKEYVNKGLTY